VALILPDTRHFLRVLKGRSGFRPSAAAACTSRSQPQTCLKTAATGFFTFHTHDTRTRVLNIILLCAGSLFFPMAQIVALIYVT